MTPRPTRPVLAALTAVCVLAACDAPGPAPMPVVETTIARLHDALFAGRTTCRMVVQAHLDRIEAYEDRINAITVVNPAALDRADELDAALAAGEAPGPLFCVPMLVKDNFDTHDMVTTAGSAGLAASVPPDDAFMVRRIREAGAIVIAKTNMAEWAFSPRQSVSSSFDTTRNAYALDRVPAGSSGGTASGVAAGFGVIGLGSDTGNSIRGPASRLALVGIRSTIGLTSRDGVVPLSFDRDIAGPMGRTVDDVARVFDVVAGHDPLDPYTEPARERRADDYTSFLDADGLQGARIGVPRALVDADDADPGIVAVFERALGELASLGAEVVDPFEFDLEAQMEREGMFCRRFRYDMRQYLRSLGDAAPFDDVVQVLETGEYGADAERSLRSARDAPLDEHPAEWDPPCPDYAEHPERQGFVADLVAAMDAAGVDALVYPTWLTEPAHIDRANEEYGGDNSQRVAPATGMPAITVPMGWTGGAGGGGAAGEAGGERAAAPDGPHPAGLQILARPWDDGLLLRYAYAYEQATKYRRAPEGFAEIGRR